MIHFISLRFLYWFNYRSSFLVQDNIIQWVCEILSKSYENEKEKMEKRMSKVISTRMKNKIKVPQVIATYVHSENANTEEKKKSEGSFNSIAWNAQHANKYCINVLNPNHFDFFPHFYLSVEWSVCVSLILMWTDVERLRHQEEDNRRSNRNTLTLD